MSAGCSAATPSIVAAGSSSTTPPLGGAASTSAHFRLGRTSRRSSSSGSSSSNGGIVASSNAAGGSGASAVTTSVGVGASRKRRRHSTLSSGIASGSEEEGERAPAMFRLRLGSYVSDFRLARTRSQSPGSPLHQATPSSPSSALRHRHQLRIQTAAQAEPPPLTNAQDTIQPNAASNSLSPTYAATRSAPYQRDSDVEMDLDVQSTFQAMQVDSPSASPSPTVLPSFFPTTSIFPPVSALQRPSPIPSDLLSPLVTDTRYPRSPSPLSASSYPSAVSLVTNASAVSPGVFPSASTLLAARRSSRQSLSTQHTPASSSPLARTISFDPTASSALHHPAFFPHPQVETSPFHQFNQVQASIATRSRSTSTPPSPGVATEEESNAEVAVPIRRHSDGKVGLDRPHRG
ncbi:hypothetical protein PHBOTO_000634 [Pseudozyma hubeiensis]|nr:hypothetical protein PHBOTO_000634 [Pseudozyma hubeiensis]